MVDFSFVSNKKIIFGCGKTVELIPILSALKGEILFLTGQSIKETRHFDKLTILLNEGKIAVDYKTVTGEPSPEIVDTITESCRNKTIAGVVALGGGSVLDAGKAVSAMLCEEGSIQDYLEGVGTRMPSGRKVPFYALPTTAGTGSECTKNAVISRPGPEGFKKSLRHENYIPDVAIIDPDWTESLPAQIGASCGMDAFSQLLESYLSTQASPLTDCMAEEGLKRFFNSFSAILEGKGDSSNREDISLGAALSGLTLANAGYGTVHGMAGILGGLYAIPHGSACGILMPSVMRQTLSILMERDPSHPSLIKAVKLGREIKRNSALPMEEAVFALISQLDLWEDQAALPSLGEYGIKKEDLKKIVALSSNRNNPYAFSEAERLEILENCY
jgi:alcohol dehydrogenase class IV